MEKKKAPAGGGRMKRLLESNFNAEGRSVECRYQAETEKKQGNGADGCRLAAFLRWLHESRR